MAIVMQLTWQGVTPAQYDDVRDKVDWEQHAPKGGVFHVAWFKDDALHAVDVWESAEDFQAFVDDRLMPVVRSLEIEGDPDLEIQPMHRLLDNIHHFARS